MSVATVLIWVVPATVVALALVAWLMVATLSGLRGREPFETNPGELIRRIKELEERVERLERERRE